MVHACVNGTMQNTSQYSTTVPVVGLYIAAAGFLCFLLILCDMWAGFRSKKFWFPCRLFSINSITLTLISIATKLPVDLTTAMPSAQDQLSKLSGTVFICMTMSFMLPSLAVNAEFESYANVTALSIFVVTVVVNICMQMATGLIFSFIPEHVLVLVCMLMLLIRFWGSVAIINGFKQDYSDKNKDHIRKGGNKLLERLEVCYLFGYHYCLQFISCRLSFLADVTPVCITSSLVLIQAVLRSFGFHDIKFCNGVSDYGWSMWLVVVSQVLTVAAVSFAVGVRWATNLAHAEVSHNVISEYEFSDIYLQFQYFFSLRRLPKFLEKSFRYVIFYPLTLLNFAVAAWNLLVQIILRYTYLKCDIMNAKDNKDEKLEKYDNLLNSHIKMQTYDWVETWVLRKGVADMESWMEINRKATLEHLTNLLSTVPPSHAVGWNHRELEISSLSMILVVEIAKAIITPTPGNKVSLDNIFVEAYDIIHFIDSKLNVGSSKDRLRSMSAQVIHEYGFASVLGKIELAHDPTTENSRFYFYLKENQCCGCFEETSPGALGVIQKLRDELGDFINYRSLEPKEVVYSRIEQLFVDMLHIFLAQLPAAIFTHIVESPAEEYQKRVRLGLGFLCKVQSLEPHIRFSLPPGSGIASLFDTETGPTGTQVDNHQMQGQSTADPTAAPDVEHGEIQEVSPRVAVPFP